MLMNCINDRIPINEIGVYDGLGARKCLPCLSGIHSLLLPHSLQLAVLYTTMSDLKEESKNKVFEGTLAKYSFTVSSCFLKPDEHTYTCSIRCSPPLLEA